MKIKLPQWLVGSIIGFTILIFVPFTWSIIEKTNISLSPEIPWSFPLMLIILGIIWQYLNGKWLPSSTQHTRKLWMRVNKLQAGTKIWSWTSAILLGITILSLMVISARLTEFEPGQIAKIEQIVEYPPWTIASIIIMTSLVTGIVEEVSLRGYIQKPMEIKFGAKIAIPIVALFSVLVQLPNMTIAPYLIPLFLIGSVGWSTLAYMTDSIIPGVVIHCAVNTITFSWIWGNIYLAKCLSSDNIIANGMDKSFTITLLIALAGLIGLIFSFNKLSRTGN